MSNAFDKASLVMLPHAYEDGKVYSLKPTDRSGDFTFSRGSDTATRVGEDGYIKKETSNLLLQSNQFDTTWTRTRTSVTSGQNGYDGSSDAWLLECNEGPANVSLQQSLSSSSVVTYSVYAKAGTTNWLNIRTQASGDSVWFDLANGVIGTQKPTTIASKIESVGNDWYRLSIVFDSCTAVRFYVVDGNNNFAVTLGASVYIQDAQLNQGLVAQDYLETTTAPVYGGLTDNMPRLDYSGGATCPSLLLEPSRTNLIPYSEYYEGSSYVLETNATLDSTLYESPEGVNNAYKLNLPSIISRITHAVQYNGAHTFSVWMKADTSGTISLRCATGNPAVSEQKNVTTEWQKFDITATDANYWQVIRNSGDTLSSVYIYGHQIEQGPYPTSYIPTYGSSQTRAFEVNGLGLSPVLSDNYSVFAEVTRITETFINNGEFIDYRSSSDTNDRLRMYNYNNGRIRFRLYYNDGTNNSFFSNSGDWAKGDTIKFCFTYNNGNIFIYANGEQLHSISQTLNNLNSVNIEQEKFKQLLHFDFTLTEQEAIALTTL